MNVLNLPTLVLNASWHPIGSTTVRNAICNVITKKAFFVNHLDYSKHDLITWMDQEIQQNDLFIRTSHGKLKVPEIMLLSKFNRSLHRKVVFCRSNLWKRDCGICQYCGIRPKYDSITIDHIIPKSRGGSSCFENCVLCCVSCNVKKKNKTPEEAHMRLMRYETKNNEKVLVKYFRPKHPSWHPMYTTKKTKFPKSWSSFIKNLDDTLYWDVELET